MTTEFLIRSAVENEIPAVESLSVAAYAQYRTEVPARVFEAYVDDLCRLAQYWDEAEVLVVEHAGRIVGSVLFYADASHEGLGARASLPSGWAGFRKLSVHPEMRGHGLGRKLVASCMDKARQLGAPVVGIHTASFMKAALSLYESMGFQRCAQYDLNAADILGAESGADTITVLAYRATLFRSDVIN